MSKSKNSFSVFNKKSIVVLLVAMISIFIILFVSCFFFLRPFEKENKFTERQYLSELSSLGEKLRQKQSQNDELEEQLLQLGSQRVKPGQTWSYCLGMTEISVLANLDINETAGSTLISQFFNNPEIKELEKTGSVHQLCNPDTNYNSFLSFVMYGDYGEFNNIIGTFTADRGMIADKKFNSGMGDIGVCRITGSIGNGIGYVCGGGDGPGGHYSIYLLNPTNGKSTLIKKCTFFSEEKDKCTIDLFKII